MWLVKYFHAYYVLDSYYPISLNIRRKTQEMAGDKAEVK
jgi:hypothetical protein